MALVNTLLGGWFDIEQLVGTNGYSRDYIGLNEIGNYKYHKTNVCRKWTAELLGIRLTHRTTTSKSMQNEIFTRKILKKLAWFSF